MKKIKIIFTIIILIITGMLISYADTKYNNEYDRLIQTFSKTDADFKFYNIKANGFLNYDVSKEQMLEICLEIINNLGLEESNLSIEEKWNKKEKQIYINGKTNEQNVSVIFNKKNDKEAYIMVDILQNKVYKNIVGIYTILENIATKYVFDVDINTCLSGEYAKKLQLDKCDDILDKILYNMSAKQIDRVEEDNFISVTADSKILQGNDLEYLGNKINLNIGIRYSEDEDKTLIYIATPIIKLDY